MKELTHKYAFDQSNNMIKADSITEEKKRNKYYIIGKNKNTGEIMHENVLVVMGGKKRPHFRRYPEKSSLRNNNFVLDEKEWKETLIHRIAKDAIKNLQGKCIVLPACKNISNNNERHIIVEQQSMFVISDVKIEYYDKTINRRYDALITSKSGREIIIEFYVKHKVSTEKLNDIKLANKEIIEIDLSDLVNTAEDELESKITNILTIIKYNKLHWLNNINNNKFENWLNNQVKFEMRATKYQKEKDGDWYINTRDRYDDIPNCPRYSHIKYGSKTQMVENICKDCSRCRIVEWDGITGTLICDQSNIDIKEIFKFLYNT